jgi:hypothetical protein
MDKIEDVVENFVLSIATKMLRQLETNCAIKNITKGMGKMNQRLNILEGFLQTLATMA